MSYEPTVSDRQSLARQICEGFLAEAPPPHPPARFAWGRESEGQIAIAVASLRSVRTMLRAVSAEVLGLSGDGRLTRRRLSVPLAPTASISCVLWRAAG